MAGTMLSAWRSSAVLAGVVLVGAALIDAQPTQDDEDYPHAYPRPGVEKRFENERVIIWEVVWLDGVPMPYHRHRYDMTGVFLRWGPLRVTRPDGTFTVSEEPSTSRASSCSARASPIRRRASEHPSATRS